MPKLSVITVCMNNRDGLEKTILSVIGQSFTNFEFIIIDGASSDGSLGLIRQYEDRISWWISEKDTGIYNAMNKGIQQAVGEYCLFLNSGDRLSSNEILQSVFSETHDADIVYGNLIRKKGKRSYRITKYPDKLTLYHFYAPVPSLHHQASFIKRNLFDKFGFYREDFKIVADWEFFFRAVILKNCTTKHIEQNISIFDSFGISSGSNFSEQELKINILKSHFPERVLEDYEDFKNKRGGSLISVKRILSKNELFYKMVRFFYLPFIRLVSYINYLRLKK